MNLNVRYYSQYIEVEDSFWNIRSCGAACLKMVSDFHGKKIPSILELCEEAKEKGGYDMENGWVHDYLVNKAKEYGLSARREEKMVSTELLIRELANGNPVIVSVEKRVLEQRRFHMIVLVGYDDGQSLYDPQFLYHEPESTDPMRGSYRKCREEELMDYWRGKAIFISK